MVREDTQTDVLTDPSLRSFLANSRRTQEQLSNLALLRPDDGLLQPISERRLRELERTLERCPELTGTRPALKEELDAERASRLEVARKVETLRMKKLRQKVAAQHETEKKRFVNRAPKS